MLLSIFLPYKKIKKIQKYIREYTWRKSKKLLKFGGEGPKWQVKS